MSINVQLEKADRQLQAVEELLQRIEEKLVNVQGNKDSRDWNSISDLVNEGFTCLATSNLAIRATEDLNSRETSMDKRQAVKQRLKELRVAHERFKETLSGYKVQVREAENAHARTTLLARPTGDGNRPISDGTRPTSIPLTTELMAEREHHILGQAEGRLGEYISLGSNTLDSLRNQRAIMKGAQRRVLDVGTSLGISQSIMRIVSRRTAQDRYIFYGGVILIFLTIYLCWKYI